MKTTINIPGSESWSDTAGAGGIQEDELATFYIHVSPSVRIGEDASHPILSIIKDIVARGTSHVTMVKNRDNGVDHWEMFVACAASQSSLESHFNRLEGECSVRCAKLIPGDLFEQPGFTEYVGSVRGESYSAEKVGEFIARGMDALEGPK
jgi:hypothetical protein